MPKLTPVFRLLLPASLCDAGTANEQDKPNILVLRGDDASQSNLRRGRCDQVIGQSQASGGAK